MGKREEKKRKNQKKIKSSGLQLFVSQGYQGCTIDDIVKDAGIARGTFYLYYPDKLSLFEELLVDLYQPIIAILEASLKDLQKENQNALAHQIRYIRTAIELAFFLETKKEMIPLHFREIWTAGDQGIAIRKWRQSIETLSQELIEASISHNLIRAVPVKLTALAVVGATERIVWGWLHNELQGSRRALAQGMAALFWRGIAPE